MGAKSDAGDAHVLAEIVRLDRDHHRQIAGDTDLADAVKLLARAHQTAIWERTRQVLRELLRAEPDHQTGGLVLPSGLFVIFRSCLEAAMQDADEAVRELAHAA